MTLPTIAASVTLIGSGDTYHTHDSLSLSAWDDVLGILLFFDQCERVHTYINEAVVSSQQREFITKIGIGSTRLGEQHQMTVGILIHTDYLTVHR